VGLAGRAVVTADLPSVCGSGASTNDGTERQQGDSVSGVRVDRAELARVALDGYLHGPTAATDGTYAALAKTPEPDAMMLVEGVSDQIAVETLAVRLGRDLATERVAVVPIGGAGAIGRMLAEHASATLRLVALCDAGEEALVRRRIEASGLQVSVFVCVTDLEAELIRAVGVETSRAVVDSQGDLGSFTTLQKQLVWRGQPPEAQLRRFIGAGARRKLRYARLLIDAAVDLDRAPRPLVAALDASCRQVHHRDRPGHDAADATT
jgi:hypothetical protein